MDILNKYLGTIRVPTNNDNIYNEECVYSFDSPVGIFMQRRLINTLNGFFCLLYRKPTQVYT